MALEAGTRLGHEEVEKVEYTLEMENVRAQNILERASGLAVTILFLALAACSPGPAEQPAAGAAATPDAEVSPPPEPLDLGLVVGGTAPENPYGNAQIERGEYLVRFGSCNDCHTPWNFDPVIGAPRPDMSRMLSGHPSSAPDPQGAIGPGDIALIGPTFTSFVLPFGTIYSINLTPDIETGTGTWTEEMFLDIFRTGRHLGGDGRGVLPPMPWLWIRNLTDEDLISIFAYLRSIPPIYNLAPEPAVPEEAIWQIRDADDVLAVELPHAEWAHPSE